MSAERSSGAHLRTKARALRVSVISLAPEDSCRLNASTLEGSIVRRNPGRYGSACTAVLVAYCWIFANKPDRAGARSGT